MSEEKKEGIVPHRVEIHTKTIEDKVVKCLVDFYEEKELPCTVFTVTSENTEEHINLMFFMEDDSMIDWVGIPYGSM